MPNYMDGFKCLGAECENDCCHGWQVAVDRKAYKALKVAMSRNKAEREQFRLFLRRNRSEKKGQSSFAHIKLEKDNNCPFLDDQKLCAIQSSYGVRCLGLVCQTYPKVMARVGGRTELHGSLSCPEVARRCLLHEESLDLCAKPITGPADIPPILTRLCNTAPPDPYKRYLDDIRQVGMELLADRKYPVTSRLFFLSYFTDSITPFFHLGCEGLDESRLLSEISNISDPVVRDELHGEFLKIDSRNDFAMALVQGVLLHRTRQGRTDFDQLLLKVLKNEDLLERDVAEIDDVSGSGNDANSYKQAYQQRKVVLEPAFGSRLDQYFENYCRNFWFGDWYTDSPNPAEHARKLIIRVTVLKFLLFCHPLLNQLVNNGQGPECSEEQQMLLDKVAVETFALFSRGLDHNREFIARIQEALTAQGIQELALQTLLLKI